MTETATRTFDLSNREFCVLLARFSPAFRMGYRDPFPGWDEREILADLPAMAESLRKKNLLDAMTAPAGSFWHEMLCACAHPSMVLFLSSQFASSSQSHRTYFFGSGGFVEVLYPSPAGVRLNWLSDRNLLFGRLARDLRLDTPLISKGEPFRMSGEILRRANTAFRDGKSEEGEAALRSAGLERETIKRVCETLRQPAANCAAACLGNPDLPGPPAARGFAVLEGRADIWILQHLETDGLSRVEWIPASGDRIRNAMELLIGGNHPGALAQEREIPGGGHADKRGE